MHSYALELEQIKGTISSETFKEPSQREDAKKVVYMALSVYRVIDNLILIPFVCAI
jgi:hypothetical protein